MADAAKIEEPAVKISYLHAPAMKKDGTIVEPRRDGRLIATVATREIGPGKLAVAVSRCNPLDQPSRFSGRKRAEARLNRFVGYIGDGKVSFNGEEPQLMKESQVKKTEQEIRRKMVFTMTREELKSEIIEKNPFLLGSDCPYGVAEGDG